MAAAIDEHHFYLFYSICAISSPWSYPCEFPLVEKPGLVDTQSIVGYNQTIRMRALAGVKQAMLGLMGLLPAALACFVLPSFVASIVIPIRKMESGEDGGGLVAGVLYLLAVCGGAWFLKRLDSCPERRVVAWMIGASIVLKTAVAFVFRNLPFNIDQSLFHLFSTRLAMDGFDESTLSSLSSYYDYPLWTARSFPVHYLLQKLGGPHALACVKALNILAASLIMCIAYDLARHVLPSGRRKWAVFLLLVLPFQTFWVSDYSHHLFSSLYLLTFVWCACKLTFSAGKTWLKACLSGLATACLLLMAWQGGVDWIALGVAGGIVVLHSVFHSNMRQSILLAFFLLVIPACGRTILKGPLLMDRIQSCDLHRQNSVLPAFMARGWNFQTGGEYYRRYEQLDRATPWPRKPVAMYRLVLSHMRHAPVETCFLLPVVKTTKLFLVGYASNIEESLVLSNSPAHPGVRMVRRCGAFVFLLFVLVGSIRLAAAKEFSFSWIPVLLVPVLTWGAYVLAGETSPRYSVFCQPFLALVGACALGETPGTMPGRRVCLSRMLVVCLSLLTMAGIAVGCIRMMPQHFFYEDLRESQMGTMVKSGANPVFERVVRLPAGTERTSMVWPVPYGASRCSFYSLQCTGAMEGAEVEIFSGNGSLLAEVPLDQHNLPEYAEIHLPEKEVQLQVTVSRPVSLSQEEGAYAFGYLLWGMP